MSQHDYVIANASGAVVRADINSVLQAIISGNSGTSAPSTTVSGMWWLDTTGGAPYTLKIRDAGNNHWLSVASITDPGSDGNLSMMAIEGTSVLSTGESGASKFLREDGDGSCSWQTPSGGKILQVLQTVKSDKQSATASGSVNWTDISGFEVAITPSATDSKILITASITYGSITYSGFFKLRAKTGSGSYADLGVGDASGSQTRTTGGGVGGTDDQAEITTNTMLYLDSPSTTSVRTYSAQFTSRHTDTMTINYGAGNQDADYVGTGISSITAMEVGA